jgi:protein-tyrosine phosphatase
VTDARRRDPASPDGSVGPVPEWHVDVEGCTNFRDVGGWACADGTRMRHRTLYRSDDPIRLTPSGRARVEALGLVLVVDLRQEAQVARGPGFLPAGRTVHVPLVDRVIDVRDPPALARPADLAELYEGMLERSREPLGRALDLVAEHVGRGPVLVHCAYGKDRAGLLTALVQAAVGVPVGGIAAEYARSDGPARRRRAWMIAEPLADDPPIAAAPEFLFTAPEAAMTELLERVVTRHGSLDGWVRRFPIAPETVDRLRSGLLTGPR